MRRPCIIIDIDNTLIDTAVRKQLILSQKLSIEVTINQIRDDFKLVNILGETSEERKRFFEIFDSPDGIKEFKAPLFQGSLNVLNAFSEEGVHIIYLTARPENLRDATIVELTELGLDLSASVVFLKPMSNSSTNNLDYKSKMIADLGLNYQIVAVIGDRIEDVKASAQNNVPAILLTSTTHPSEIFNADVQNPAGFQTCADWAEIEQTIRVFISGNKEIQEFRKQMIDLYSKWLGEIDNKLRVSVSIASILCALSGKTLIDLSEKNSNCLMDYFILYCMLLVFLCSLISLVYSLRSLTSRFTSGEKSGQAVGVRIKQGVSILFGKHKNEMLKGDAIWDFENFKSYDTVQKASAHRTFFYKKYQTYDPEALWNFRFFSIRAANYSKLYGERLASHFLIAAIALLGIWVISIIVLRTKKVEQPINIHHIEVKIVKPKSSFQDCPPNNSGHDSSISNMLYLLRPN